MTLTWAKKPMNPDVATGTVTEQLYNDSSANAGDRRQIARTGGGGYSCSMCRTNRQHAVRQALHTLGGQFTDFAFDDLGLQTWRSSSG